MNSIFASSHTKRDFKLTRLAGFLGPPMSEYVIGQIISTERNFPLFWESQTQQLWQETRYYRTLDKLTLGVLGATGDIGSCICKAAKNFGMNILGYGRTPKETLPGFIDEMFYGSSNLPSFLSKVDYLVSVVPSTPETRGLLNGNILQSCKPSVVFISVGR